MDDNEILMHRSMTVYSVTEELIMFALEIGPKTFGYSVTASKLSFIGNFKMRVQRCQALIIGFSYHPNTI